MNESQNQVVVTGKEKKQECSCHEESTKFVDPLNLGGDG